MQVLCGIQIQTMTKGLKLQVPNLETKKPLLSCEAYRAPVLPVYCPLLEYFPVGLTKVQDYE